MTIVAVIDIGTNTTRLLVRDTDDPRSDLHREIRITRLGHDLEKTGQLGEKGKVDTCTAVQDYVETAVANGAAKENIHIFATAAARNAINGSEYISYISDVTGCSAAIISGEEEGNAAFSGAMSGLKEKVPTVVFDIGGGSTEFAISSKNDPAICGQVVSIPIGSVRMTKRHLEHDPPLPEELSNLITESKEYFKDVQAQILDISSRYRWVGVAATATTAATVEMGLQDFDVDKVHEFILTKEMAEEVFRTLATESLADRVHNPGLEKERADVIVGGMGIIVSIMRHFELNEFTVSCSDLLDGLWLSVVSRG